MEDAEHFAHDGRAKLKKTDERNADDNGDTWMDMERTKLAAYEYLCHIGEAKEWMEACTDIEIGSTDTLTESLRNGIALARLAKKFHPASVKKIFEDTSRLQFRHSDNINFFFGACKSLELPEVFMFELTDLYDQKNIPKVIYCIHALSHMLHKRGLAPKINDLLGKLEFSDDVLKTIAQGLEDSGVSMPAFGNIQNALAAEMEDPEEVARLEEAKKAENKRLEEERLAELQRLENERAAEAIRVENARLAEVQRLKDAALKAERDAIEAARLAVEARKQYLNDNTSKIIKAQSIARMHKIHNQYVNRAGVYDENSPKWSRLQPLYRAQKLREKDLKRMNELKAHSKDIIKIQALWRGRREYKQYKALRMAGGGATAKTLQQYLMLLDDEANDFSEEGDLDALRKGVVKKIRENLETELDVNGLDAKIALLVKNRISVEEVVKFTSKKMRSHLAHEQQVMLDKEGSIVTLKGSDKETVVKRKHYEELLYLLQTQPKYLSQLLRSSAKFSSANATKQLESVMLTIFGYAQNNREEYLFLTFVDDCLSVELSEVTKIEDFLRDNPSFIRLTLQYTRGAKERRFLRDLLQPLLSLILTDNQLDLENDSVTIYKQQIRNEELNTGEKSTKPYEITPQDASVDPAVKAVQLERCEKLVKITDLFLTAIIGSLKSMPFGIRYIAMKLKLRLKQKFTSNVTDEELSKIVGNLIYYRYINPAIIAPEAFDVIDSAISPIQRKNLAEVTKILYQIQVGKLIVGKGEAIDVVNKFISSSFGKFAAFVKQASSVETLEEFFEMNEFVDMGRSEKPSIYITPEEVINVHAALATHLSSITTVATDPLSIILSELGACPPTESAARGPGSEVTLHLTNRFAKTEDPKESEKQQLIKETKRLILVVIRMTCNKSLLKLLEEPVTEAQQQKFDEYLSEGKNIGRSTESLEISSASPRKFLAAGTDKFITFAQLKGTALENLSQLEKLGVVTIKDEYQSMLDNIADDMLSKQRRRKQRRKEHSVLKATMKNLVEKAGYLGDQKKSYNDYIDACMQQLQSKTKGKAKKPMLFSKQYNHLRDLQKSGQMPKFGSYKFTAQELHKKGVLISIDDYNPKQYGGISLTISCNETGVFNVEAQFLGVKIADKMELRLDDLLQSQYNRVDVVTLFDIANVNLNLLIFLINKKFFV